jgi:hypothetical protein
LIFDFNFFFLKQGDKKKKEKRKKKEESKGAFRWGHQGMQGKI